MSDAATTAAAADTASHDDLEWMKTACLSVVVVGASGDLAKKKTYPSFLNLYADGLLPAAVQIWGFARSKLTDANLRDRLRPYLLKTKHSPAVVETFLSKCTYQGGTGYGDIAAFEELRGRMEAFEKEQKAALGGESAAKTDRLFYFAIPPNVFAATGLAIKQTCMQDPAAGWTRLIVEKPFGRDSESFETLNSTLRQHFTEDHLYRIDHYLGKEMVQNLLVLRFSNLWFEKIWNAEHVENVILTFKEPFGTEGRGGYFDQYGIIRDILQNHLLQVMTLLAMEAPIFATGPKAGKAIRDGKVAVLNAICPIRIEDVVLGQYEGYADDPTITNKDTNTPTFCTIRLFVNTPRWHNVPFILKAGKALDERKAEMRIQFKDAPAADFMFQGADCPRNELVLRMQPDEAVYFKTNVKSPGFSAIPVQSELEVNYKTRYFEHDHLNPDAYTRLILDVLLGKQSAFVRDDELRRAWEIFTPLLHAIEQNPDKLKPVKYKQGSRGPVESDNFIAQKAGYRRNENYVFYEKDGDTMVTQKQRDESKKTAAAAAPAAPSSVPDASDLCDVGLWGLAVMGQNFALNMAEHGFKVAVGNRSPSKVDDTVARAKAEGNLPLRGFKSAKEFVANLSKPRKVIILVQAGKPVDDTIAQLSEYMQPGDVLVDGGNEWFPNQIRRAQQLEPKKIHFVGMGISGGEEGARNGPSLMPGGPKEAYDLIEPILTKCAAQVEGSGPCAGYLGPIGAGNYVKMVHNGIEYGDMQLIAEVYDVLKNVLHMSNEQMADLFDEWNKGELESYLIQITATILRKKEEEGEGGEGHVVDYVLDKTGMKGTGKWTVQEGAEKGVAVPTMAAALDVRMLSGRKEEREKAQHVIAEPCDTTADADSLDKQRVIEDLRAALYASKVCSYAQGLSLIQAASDKYKWNVNLALCARLWMGGCIIRAKLLKDIQQAFAKQDSLVNLLVDPGFAKQLNERSQAWRRLIALAVTRGIACPSLCSSLQYLDLYRRGRLPANLTQAQRDFFGGHTYERTDKPAGQRFHTAWTDAHKDIGDANRRTEGEKLQT